MLIFVLMIILNARKDARAMTMNHMKLLEQVIKYVHVGFYGKTFKASLCVTFDWLSHTV